MSRSRRNKPLYENVGIGDIIKRIGECNALVDDYELFIRFTQQSPREDECRDLCITTGSKLIVIDFKAPDEIHSDRRVYRGVSTRIGSLENIIGSDNLFLGLLHALLAVEAPQSSRGYFLHVVTPMTTVFIPLSSLSGKFRRAPGGVINFGDIEVRGVDFPYCPCLPFRGFYRPEDLVALATIPSCRFANIRYRGVSYVCHYLRLVETCPCLCSFCGISCGGLCRVLIYANINNGPFWERVFTLASLLWMMRCCRLGHQVRDADRDKIINNIIEFSSKKDIEGKDNYIYLFIYTPGIGFRVVPLGGRSKTI